MPAAGMVRGGLENENRRQAVPARGVASVLKKIVVIKALLLGEGCGGTGVPLSVCTRWTAPPMAQGLRAVAPLNKHS